MTQSYPGQLTKFGNIYIDTSKIKTVTVFEDIGINETVYYIYGLEIGNVEINSSDEVAFKSFSKWLDQNSQEFICKPKSPT